MDFLYAHPPPTGYLDMRDFRMRVYFSCPIDQIFPNLHRLHPGFIIQSLCYNHSLPYPYTWHLVGNHVAVVNHYDLYEYVTSLPSIPSFLLNTNQQYPEQSYESDDEALILDDIGNDEIMNDSFEEATSHVQWSGLTKKFISKNLQVTRYCEEKGEICVVCQDEFERNERLGVLKCKHRYHRRCITKWLVRQNVCPVCKGEGLSV